MGTYLVSGFSGGDVALWQSSFTSVRNCCEIFGGPCCCQLQSPVTFGRRWRPPTLLYRRKSGKKWFLRATTTRQPNAPNRWFGERSAVQQSPKGSLLELLRLLLLLPYTQKQKCVWKLFTTTASMVIELLLWCQKRKGPTKLQTLTSSLRRVK